MKYMCDMLKKLLSICDYFSLKQQKKNKNKKGWKNHKVLSKQ